MFIVEKAPKSVASEAYKALRTNIQYSSIDKKMKVILITSSEPGEGKSTTSGNLAISLAQDGKKVLVIDCDLRKPSIHKLFKESNLIGLSEVLLGKETFTEAMNEYGENIDILTSGNLPPNPSEMLGSKAMESLLEELREVYDHIIIDSPPIHAVSDAQILATKVDGTLLVVKAEKTKKDSVQRAKEQINKVNGKIIGAVLNSVDSKRDKYYYYYGEDK
ncbi:MAG: CpsD/CapB family tyrosine-protein kinase [Sarcina sp.]